MSGEELKVARVTVTVELADGSARTVTAERPEKVDLHAWREPVDLMGPAADPVSIAPTGAAVSITGGDISTGYVPPQ